MTETISADLCVIGAGSGGLSVAAGAAQLGRKVVLIEKAAMGGDCLNYGCVPSKSLIAAAARAHEMRTASKYGIQNSEPVINFPAVMEHVQGVIAAIAPHDSQERFEGLGVQVLREHASFVGPRTVIAGKTTVIAKHFVIATGSSPRIPLISGLSNIPYLTNETLFQCKDLPDHLIILGGGPIGLEMAQAFCRLGSKVTVLEADVVLGNEDPEAAAVLKAQLLEEGVSIMEGAKVDAIFENMAGLSVAVDGKTISGSHLLVATGRSPNVEGLGLEEAGVDYDASGIKVCKRLRTSNKRIYAIGDVIGEKQFTHIAGYHASIIVKNILFKIPSKRKDEQSPHVTYTQPELAHVGLKEEEALKTLPTARVTRWSYKDNDRAQAERELEGFAKIVTKKNGDIIGATIVGRHAGELIQLWTVAIAKGLNIKTFTEYIAPYPTYGEINKRAAGAYFTPTLFSQRTKNVVSLLSIFD